MNLDQEKRVMLAFALSIAMLILYRMYFVKEPPPEPKKAEAPITATHPGKPGEPAAPANPAPTKPAPPPPAALEVVQGTKAEDIVVESKVYRVTFSTQGAVVKSWVLKQYRDGNDKLLDTVNAEACETLGFPISLRLPNSALDKTVNEGIYRVKAEHGKSPKSAEVTDVQPGTVLPAPVTLDFIYSDGKVQVKKQFSFDADYAAKVMVSASNGTGDLPVQVTWPGGFGDHTLPFTIIQSSRQGVYGSAGDLTTVAQSKVKEERTASGPLQLAGLEDKFFAQIFLPDDPDQVSFHLVRQDWEPAKWTEKDKPNPLAGTLAETQTKPLAFRLFVGPKSLDVLKAVNPPLDSLVNFGWFSIIAKPLFMALRYINDHWTHNYGWAIVLLTVIITTGLFPLKLKSIRSAQEMQKVQPIIKGIQDKYKGYKLNDPRKQKMNEEVMEIYKQHGVNPFGSCLPMLLQMPILYGFYEMLDVAIELRHAPWIWWMKDLSAPDCLKVMGHCVPVLVILMTVASFILQSMTPMAAVDPSQQRMMKFMPLFFAFIFLKLPSGMVLYWLTSSVMQILQQVIINRRMPPPPPLPVPRKSAEAKG